MNGCWCPQSSGHFWSIPYLGCQPDLPRVLAGGKAPRSDLARLHGKWSTKKLQKLINSPAKDIAKGISEGLIFFKKKCTSFFEDNDQTGPKMTQPTCGWVTGKIDVTLLASCSRHWGYDTNYQLQPVMATWSTLRHATAPQIIDVRQCTRPASPGRIHITRNTWHE